MTTDYYDQQINETVAAIVAILNGANDTQNETADETATVPLYSYICANEQTDADPCANEQITSATACAPYRRCFGKRCAACLEIEQRQIRRRLDREIRDGRRYDHIILTAPTTTALRSDSLSLQASFKDLRRLSAWKTVKGGYAKLEAQQNADGRWTPHIHVVAATDGVDAGAISAEWERLTSGRAFVKAIADSDHLSNALWYVAAPPQLALLGSESVYEFNRETSGLKLKQLLGDWRGEPLFPRRGRKSAA